MKAWRAHMPFVVEVLEHGRWELRARTHLVADAWIIAATYDDARVRDARRHDQPGAGVVRWMKDPACNAG